MTGALVAAVVISLGALAFGVVTHRRLQKAQVDLDQFSCYDRLTGLPNRTVLHQALEEVLRDARRTTTRVAVISIELRSFASVNTTYGREVGDELMVAVARRLRRAQRSGERLVRYGGPQFVVVCPDVGDGPRAQRRAEEFLAAVGGSFSIRQDNIRIAANAGVVLTGRDHSSVDELLVDAATALGDAAADGPGVAAVYDHAMRARLTPATAEPRLRQALDAGEFALRYLPVVRLSDQRLIGVEALLRWNNPDRGMVNPAEFLKALDDTGLIVPVGEFVLREAARQASAWRRDYPEVPVTVTVNLSPRQLGQVDLHEKVEEILGEVDCDPSLICLEITEGALVRDVESAWMTLREAKKIGCQLALDDFGTGNSSLSHLRRFRLDVLKIDRSFVGSVVESREDAAIVRHIVDLARALGMMPVGEGVETPEQARTLAEVGCEAAQGFLFGEPLSPAGIDALLEVGSVEAVDEANRRRFEGAGLADEAHPTRTA